MRTRCAIAAPVAILVAAGLAACAPALPETVVPDSVITVGWTGELTSTNAAAAPTPGNVDIAAPTRAGFGDLVGGEFVADEAFGTVAIVSQDPFIVRYDLTEPAWSDGIPLDAADLVLGWAAASGLLSPGETGGGGEGDAADSAGADSTEAAVPRIDEFARAIEVTYPHPVSDWQQRIAVPVPAHVVGRLALGLDDPMEAKQAVVTAIRDRDPAVLATIAAAWNEGFAVPSDGEIPAELLLSSGPFRVDAVRTDTGGQSVTLVPNAAYRGPVTARVAKIDLVPAGEDAVGAVGTRVDAVQVAPVTANHDPIEALERKDVTVDTTNDGTVWALQLNPVGVFAGQQARAAFLRAIPANALIERGGGVWASDYTATTSMLSAPGSRAYDIVTQDSGFAAALAGADDSALEREATGVPSGARVCLLYDRTSEFASGAFAAARDAATEAGWSVADCGADDLESGLTQGGWDAALTRVAIPQTVAQIAAQWGSQATTSISRNADPERDALIEQLGEATDVYAARDIRAQIEATIVRTAVALPIAVNPTLTIVDKDVVGIAPRDGTRAPLTYGAAQWEVVR